MNSILQCLCKTKLLRELFLSNSRDDLLKGKLAKGNLFQNSFFATILKKIYKISLEKVEVFFS